MKPCHIDGIIFCLIAFFGAITVSLSTDDAAKYIPPAALWFTKGITTAISATCLALKMFRSTSYAQYRDVENKKMVKTQAAQDAIDDAAKEETVKEIKQGVPVSSAIANQQSKIETP